MNWPFFVCALITAISAVVRLGFAAAAVLRETGDACARSLPLAIASAVPFLTGSLAGLEAIACVMIIVQACDAAIGAHIQDHMKTFGPAGTALANLAALIWLVKRRPSDADNISFWKLEYVIDLRSASAQEDCRQPESDFQRFHFTSP